MKFSNAAILACLGGAFAVRTDNSTARVSGPSTMERHVKQTGAHSLHMGGASAPAYNGVHDRVANMTASSVMHRRSYNETDSPHNRSNHSSHDAAAHKQHGKHKQHKQHKPHNATHPIHSAMGRKANTTLPMSSHTVGSRVNTTMQHVYKRSNTTATLY